PEPGSGAGRVLHPLRRARVDAVGLSVAPDLRRQDRAMPVVDRIADALTDEVGADRPAAEAVPLEQLALLTAVRVVGDGALDLEVIAPAGELQAVEPPA